jgi:hypothetical protein
MYRVKQVLEGQGRLIKSLIFIGLLLILAACSSVQAPTNGTTDFYYIASVDIKTTAKQADIEKTYGGKAVVFKPEAGFAILGFSKEAGELTTLSTDPNQNVLKAPEVSAAGFNAWAGGWNAWAGGWNAWAGGWNAWAGGTSTIPTLPGENRYSWNQLRLAEANTLAKNFGAGAKVAVIDTGIDLNHPMFSGRLAPSSERYDFVDNDSNPQEVSGGSAYGHGTAVAGLILQVAPKATILPIRALRPDGSGDVDKIVSAVNWAVERNAKVINLSLGTYVDIASLKTIIDYATSLGVYVVASAGNEGNSSTLTYPAQYAKSGPNAKYLISVGSSTFDNNYMASYSNRGAALEIIAQGEQFYSVYPNSQIAQVRGTSFAAPIVAGTLALMSRETASANLGHLESYLLNSTWAMTTGERHLNIASALRNTADFSRWRNVLLVVGSSTLNSGDNALYEHLQWWLGYNVSVKTGTSVSSADASGKDLVVISSTVTAADVNTKFKNVATPVMVLEPLLFDDMAMVTTASSYYGTSTGQTQIKMVNSTHPLSAGVFWTEHEVYSAPETLTWGIPNANAIKVATLMNDTNKAVIFGYDSGASMVGLNAPARRIGFMFHDTSSTYVNSKWESYLLFDAAVVWAITGN